MISHDSFETRQILCKTIRRPSGHGVPLQAERARPSSERVLHAGQDERVLQRNAEGGISLIEIVVYIAILGIIAVFLSNFLIQIVRAYQIAQAERDVLSNARLLLETIEKNVSQAKKVYGPTSSFHINGGQLSLITKIGATPEHETAYLDMWIDNGTFWIKEEGKEAIPLSGKSVRVTMLRFERIIQGLEREAIQVTLQVDSAKPKFASSIILHMSTALRGNY